MTAVVWRGRGFAIRVEFVITHKNLNGESA